MKERKWGQVLRVKEVLDVFSKLKQAAILITELIMIASLLHVQHM